MIGSIPADQYRWLEWQAYTMAGLMLVPTASLVAVFEDRKKEARAAGIELEDMDAKLRRAIESNIGKHFGVSADVIQRRMEKENLWS